MDHRPMIAAGLAFGLDSLVSGRPLRSLPYEITPQDPLVALRAE